jgi:glycosyltransferase involved in cell wall biosynthesis
MSPDTTRLEQQLERLEQQVDELRQMLLLSYEQQADWPRRLRELRATPEYESAFMDDPLVTVRVATHNRAAMLCERALPSVSAQSYPNWEVVIVGDACTDNTAASVAALGDPRFRFYNRPSNGPYPPGGEPRWLVVGCHAMNETVRLSRGEWIAPLDDDDEWSPDHIEVLLRAAQRHRREVAYGRMRALIEPSRTETWFGTWPPEHGDFGFQAAIYHAGLSDFRYELMSIHAREPGDWNMCRRMWEAGVTFVHVQRLVGTYYVDADNDGVAWWLDRARQRPAHEDGPDVITEVN